MQKDVTTWQNRKVITMIFTDADTNLSIPSIIEDELTHYCKTSDALIAELHRVIDFMIHHTNGSIMAVLQTVPVKILKSNNNCTKWVLYLK